MDAITNAVQGVSSNQGDAVNKLLSDVLTSFSSQRGCACVAFAATASRDGATTLRRVDIPYAFDQQLAQIDQTSFHDVAEILRRGGSYSHVGHYGVVRRTVLVSVFGEFF